MKHFTTAAMIFALSILPVHAEDNQADFDATKVRVNLLQADDPSLPVGVAEPKRRVGSILAKLFDGNGQIGNIFLKAIGAVSSDVVPRWTGSSFVDGQIIDDGIRVGV